MHSTIAWLPPPPPCLRAVCFSERVFSVSEASGHTERERERGGVVWLTKKGDRKEGKKERKKEKERER